MADKVVLAEECRRDLLVLRRMPYDMEYITPQEILRIIHLCRVYDVDWSRDLEASGKEGELTRLFLVEPNHPDGEAVMRRVRVRMEPLLQDLRGTPVPDGDILWAWDVLGRLRAAVAQRLLDYCGGRP